MVFSDNVRGRSADARQQVERVSVGRIFSCRLDDRLGAELRPLLNFRGDYLTNPSRFSEDGELGTDAETAGAHGHSKISGGARSPTELSSRLQGTPPHIANTRDWLKFNTNQPLQRTDVATPVAEDETSASPCSH
jgi:hypothetical protein